MENVTSLSANGTERKVGFELEFSGVDISSVSALLSEMYHGASTVQNKAKHLVEDTELGDFVVEMDAKPVQKFAEISSEFTEGKSKNITELTEKLTESVTEISGMIVPIEVVCPPISVNDMKKLRPLINRLREMGAADTKAGLTNAFGLHINPEVVATEPLSILNYIRAFSLLYPWLMKQHNVDLTRRVSSFIEPYSDEYISHILSAHYAPDLPTLITDYIKFNPTRNKALDMLPLFAHLDKQTTMRSLEPGEKVNSRPTFHYRLPNCMLSEPSWSVEQEWHVWMRLEALALSTLRLQDLINWWNQKQKTLFFKKRKWADFIEDYMAGCNGSV